MNIMSDFQSLYGGGESTDYGADGKPVPEGEVETIHENMTEVMGDSVLNTQGENLGAETPNFITLFTDLGIRNATNKCCWDFGQAPQEAGLRSIQGPFERCIQMQKM